MKLDLDYLVGISVPVLSGFSRIEPRQWGITGIGLELMTEIGSLGRALTIWEGYRYGRKSRHQLGDELSDTFFVLLKLAWDLKIELPSTLEATEVVSPESSHWHLMRLATEIVELKENLASSLSQIQKDIKEMITWVGGMAEYYDISLRRVHEEEMRLAALWQKIFFDAKGREARRFIFWRKVVWYIVLKRHESVVERM